MSVDKLGSLLRILAEHPDDAFARYGLAMEYGHRGEKALALGQFDELHRRHPDYTPAYQMAAQTLIALGDTQQAEERLKAGIASAQRAGNQHAEAEMEGMLDELQGHRTRR